MAPLIIVMAESTPFKDCHVQFTSLHCNKSRYTATRSQTSWDNWKSHSYLAFTSFTHWVPLIRDFLLLGWPTSCWLPHHMNENNWSIWGFFYVSLKSMDQTLKIRGAAFIDFTAWRDAKKQAYEILMLINRCLLMLASNVQKDNMLWCSPLLPTDQPRRLCFVLKAGKCTWQVLSNAQTLTSTMTNDFLYHYFYIPVKPSHFPPVFPTACLSTCNFSLDTYC